MALAHGAARLNSEGYFKAYAMHVEHGIRGAEALRDAGYTEAFCLEQKLPFVCVHEDVPLYSREKGLSLENAARELRYNALQQYAGRVHADFILTAHHGDDQAETVLLKLLRGTSASGLGGMRKCRDNILRPLLGLSRQDLEEYCRQRQISYCHDSSNDDVHYTRNKIRLELLPYLEREFNASVKKALQQTAELLREDEDFINGFVRREAAARVQSDDKNVSVDTAGWCQLMPSVRKRLLRHCYFLAGGRDLGYLHTKQLDKVCLAGQSGKILQLPQKITAYYAYDKLTFTAQKMSAAHLTEATVRIENGQQIILDDGRKICVEVLAGKQPARGENNIIYPMALIREQELIIRSRRDGDRFCPYGRRGSKKLKDFFIDKKIPRTERDKKLLLCCRDKILGVFSVANGAWEQGNYDLWINVILNGKDGK